MDHYRDLSGAELVQQHWPYDGPHSPERITDAMEAMYELTRYACNASSLRARLGYAPQVYRTLGELASATALLPQLLGQLEQWARAAAEDPTLRHAAHRQGADQGAAVAARSAGVAAERFHQATAQARLLYETLSGAQQELSHLFHDLPDEGD